MLRSNATTISESKNIRDILKLVSFNSWLLLDLDNTVIEAIIELGSDQWFTKLIDHALHIIPNSKEAADLVVDIYTAVQHHINTQVVEKDIVGMIKTLQDIGIPVIGITARDNSLIDTTFRQLGENNINFGRTRDTHETDITLSQTQAVYHRGIIFCSGGDKGKCFKEFLEICDEHPEHVVMVDDKAKHLSHVQKLVESLGMRFDGLRYGYLDEKTQIVDMNAAHVQLAHIKHLLPNSIQGQIDRLQVLPSNLELNHEHYGRLFSKGPQKRRLNVAVEATQDDLVAKPSTPRPASNAGMFTSNKRRKVEPKIVVGEHMEFKCR